MQVPMSLAGGVFEDKCARQGRSTVATLPWPYGRMQPDMSGCCAFAEWFPEFMKPRFQTCRGILYLWVSAPAFRSAAPCQKFAEDQMRSTMAWYSDSVCACVSLPERRRDACIPFLVRAGAQT